MERVRVKDVATIIRGVSYKKEQAVKEYEPGYLPLLRANNISGGSLVLSDLVYVPSKLVSDSQHIKSGDILITMSSGSKSHVGKVALAKADMEYSFGAFCAKISPNHVLPSYLFYLLCDSRFRHHIESQSKGTNINNIKQSYVMDYKITLPPLSEQERIVARIEELFSQLDAGVETLKKTKAQLAVYRQAVVEDAIATAKHRGATALPFGTFVLQYQNGISKRSGEGIQTPVLRLADIKNQRISTDDGLRLIGLSKNERDRFVLKKRELLIVRVNGSENNVGRSIVVDKNDSYAACDHFIRCLVDCSQIVPEYAQLLLDSFSARKHIKENMVSSAGQNTVSQATMSSIMVFVPDISVQEKIMVSVNERLSVCDSIEQTVDMALQQAEALRQSILKDAFEGRL